MIMDYSIVPELEPESDLLSDNTTSKITTELLEPNYGKFTFGPVANGQAITIGNSLRRVLYSSILGTAITWVKIDGILHEYPTIKNVKESVEELLLNFKSIRIKSKSERSGKLRLEVEGEGKVSAADIMASSDFEIVNPALHLATLDSKNSKLSVEFNIERGVGYKVKNIEETIDSGGTTITEVNDKKKKLDDAKEDATEVVVPAFEGDMGILKDHISIISFLKPGLVKVFETDSKEENYYVEDGIIEFKNNCLSILTSNIFDIKKIDKKEVSNILAKAEKDIQNSDISDQAKYLIDHKIEVLKSLTLN